MTALWITGGIILFFILVGLIKVSVEIKAEDEFFVILKILFIRITLTPKKEKPVRLRDFEIKRFRKRRIKQIEKNRSKEKKKAEKAEKKKSGKTEKKEKQEEKKPLKDNVSHIIELLKNVVFAAVKKFGRYLTVRMNFIDITVGGEEPDKTALTYGYVCQGVSYVCELLDSLGNVKIKRKDGVGQISVRADFLAKKTKIMCDIIFGIRVWQVIAVGITALTGYIKSK